MHLGRTLCALMYLMYVDESGDVGINNSPTKYFVLSAIVIHELRWKHFLQNIVDFKREIKSIKGMNFREEIHCNELISRPRKLKRIKRNERLDIIKRAITFLNSQHDIKVFSVVVNKTTKAKDADIFNIAWNALINRFDTTLIYKNFTPSPNFNDKGIIISDNTDGDKLRKLVRQMRYYNMIPNNQKIYDGGNRNVIVQHVYEDPILRNSMHSLIHQMCDVIAYCLRQKYEPNSYMKKKAATELYLKLDSVICKQVSGAGGGIVFI